jgi:hypothetical protein
VESFRSRVTVKCYRTKARRGREATVGIDTVLGKFGESCVDSSIPDTYNRALSISEESSYLL